MKRRISFPLLTLILSTFAVLFAYLFFSSIKNLNSKEFTNQDLDILAKKCQDQIYWEQCYAIGITSMTPNSQIKKIPSLLNRLQELDSKVNGCHYIAHEIAWELVRKNLENPFAIFQDINPDTCGGGFVHGVIEGQKRYDSNFKLNPDYINKVCDNFTFNKPSYSHQSCIHTIGHIALVENDNKLNDALQFCAQLSPDKQYQCFTGVFMESVTRENLVFHGLQKPHVWDSIFLNQQMNLCNLYSNEKLTACWEELSHIIVVETKTNPKKTYQQCAFAPTKKAATACIIHASQQSITVPAFPTSATSSLCLPLKNDPQEYLSCITATIDAALLVSKNNYDKVKVFCDTLELDYKNSCITKMNEYLK